MQVYKFGGASVKDVAGVQAVAAILADCAEKTVIVVSAMGKTTQKLTAVVDAYYQESGQAAELFAAVKQQHYQDIQTLFGDAAGPVLTDVNDIFVEVDWILEDPVQDAYDYIYDQIVPVGELASSTILARYLAHQGLSVTWLDARSMILTDERYRSANVDFPETQKRVLAAVAKATQSHDLVVTQGFIGSTSDLNSTTLGLEGSDYTAGILSYCLDTEGMHIWKDVPGILTADPRRFDNPSKIDRLSYREAIEMTYYGAKVIHPKTIQPLQNKGIPLYVRPFAHPQDTGTIISSEGQDAYPPMIVVEPEQSLLSIATKDFSFVAEQHLSEIFTLLAKHQIKVNMMRNTAISFTVSTNTDTAKLDRLMADLSDFNVRLINDLELITIRHFDQETIDRLKEGRAVLYEETLRDTFQMVVRHA